MRNMWPCLRYRGLDAFLFDRERFAPVLERLLADDALLTEAAPYQVRQCAAVSWGMFASMRCRFFWQSKEEAGPFVLLPFCPD